MNTFKDTRSSSHAINCFVERSCSLPFTYSVVDSISFSPHKNKLL